MNDTQTTSFIRPDVLWREIGVRAEQTVAHLGCGAGFYATAAAKIVGRKGKVVAIDVLPHMLATTAARAEREGVADIVHTTRGNLEQSRGSGLPDHSLDWVLVANIFHQSKATDILREAARIVKPTGKVVVVEWDNAASPFGPPVQQRVARLDAIEIAQAAGLTLHKEFSPSPYHYGLIVTPA